MTYTPEVNDVITFANTYDSKTLYLVEAVGTDRVSVSPARSGTDDYTISLSLATFEEMGASPVVLDDDEMAMMEKIYEAMLLEALEMVEMVMAMQVIFGSDVALAMLPQAEMERIEKGLDQFKAGIDFLHKARADAGVSV